MFNSAILDVAIGLVFIYLVLSLVCTCAQELLEAGLRLRAADLERGLQELLQDPTRSGLVRELYRHPLIDGLYKGEYSPDPSVRRRSRTELPSYIPARNFAVALLDLARAGGEAANAPPAAAPGADPVGQIRSEILQSPLLATNPEVRRALLTLVDTAEGDAAQVRLNIQHWYDSAMDRVSGWYKRRSQIIILAMAAALTVLANADTLAIGNALARQRALSETLVASAQSFQKLQEGRPAPPAQAGKAPDPAEALAAQGVEVLQPLGLPLGWKGSDLRPGFLGWAERGLGWMITALAVSLGAPFWFDVLNKFMIVRSTVKPREKSPEQKSRD